jgi:hypothetical protein
MTGDARWQVVWMVASFSYPFVTVLVLMRLLFKSCYPCSSYLLSRDPYAFLSLPQEEFEAAAKVRTCHKSLLHEWWFCFVDLQDLLPTQCETVPATMSDNMPNHVRSQEALTLPSSVGNDDKLVLYGFFKQSKEGCCTTGKCTCMCVRVCECLYFPTPQI